MSRKSEKNGHEFDVCFSFAGEDRVFVRKVAEHLRKSGVRVFYDEYEEVGLWGKDLYEHLDDVYKNSAKFCIIFASRHYARKLWTNHERKSAQERAFKENEEYILPVRMDATMVPGLRETIGYVDVRKHTATSLSKLIRQKTVGEFRSNYLPPFPDRLFKMLGAKSAKRMVQISDTADTFLTALKRMSKEERGLLYEFFGNACPAELPRNVHINIDLLRRVSGFPHNKIRRILGGLRSLGFTTTTRDDDETPGAELGKADMLVLEWSDLALTSPEFATDVAHAMVHGSGDGYCPEHARMAWDRLDFSQLASSTAVVDKHPKMPKKPKRKAAS